MSHHLRSCAVELTDERLVQLFQGGEVEALNLLLERYRCFARSKARGYFLIGADFDDIVQEGMIGLFKAARDFRSDRESCFRAFAEVCITRQIVSAIRTATRLKHRPLNQYVSLSGLRLIDDLGDRGTDTLLIDLHDAHHSPDPAEEVLQSDELAAIRHSVTTLLSGFEVEVLSLYLDGRSYQEIGEQLGRHSKSVDNALQRIKRKLEAHLAVGCLGLDEAVA